MNLDKLQRAFGTRTAKCNDNVTEPPLEETMDPDDEEALEAHSAYIPPYAFLLNPIKMLTMGYPGAEINGFKLGIGASLSPNFTVMHDIQMQPKRPQVQTGNPMMDLYAEKTPFYATSMQYHHGTFTPTSQNLIFSLMGRWDSTGKVDAIFAKSFRNLRLKLHSSFMNSNLMYSSTQLELEHQARNTKQTFTAASHALNYNLIERLGRNLLLGLELNYLIMKNTVGAGFACRYSRSADEKFYAQYSAMANAWCFGSTFKFGEATSIAAELELGGMQQISSASIGYRRKTKAYQVNSAFRTDGEIKSMFTYNHPRTGKLKLFLGGNLWKEDFKVGYSISLGPSED